jgi:hypothetical protein
MMPAVRRFAVVPFAMVALLGSAGFTPPAAAGPTPPDPRVVCRIQAPELAAPRIDSPAAELRVTLGRLLGEHAFLVMETMRAVALESPDLDALRAGVDDNSRTLEGAIRGIYGPEGADAFGDLWQRHVDLLVDYARARAADDAAAADAATSGLATYREQFASFLSGANPHLDAESEAEALQLHVEQLTAFADDDYHKAYAVARDAFTHMFHFGDGLARAIGDQFPERFSGATIAFSPGNELRIGLDRLLAEHLVLSAEAMRAGLSGSPDRAAAEGSLAGNAEDLAEAMGELYGGGAGTAFGRLWTDHVDAYLAFIEAVRADDEAGKAASLTSLHVYHDELAAFFAEANPFVDADAVAALILQHVQSLISQVEAYDAGDYPRTVTTVRAAYTQMFDVGEALATAIVEQFPDRFEELKEIPATAAVGPKDARSSPAAQILAVLVTALAVGLVVSDPRWRRRARPPGGSDGRRDA